MKVTLLDTKTGERRDCSGGIDGAEFSVYWWIEGNGSCDCNRATAFDKDDEDHYELQRLALGKDDNVCLGCKRWLIVDVSGDLEGMTREQVLLEANNEYPKDLVVLHVMPPPTTT